MTPELPDFYRALELLLWGRMKQADEEIVQPEPCPKCGRGNPVACWQVECPRH